MPPVVNYPDHWLFVMGGALNASGANSEIWQCGIRGVPGVDAAYGDEDAVLADLQSGIGSWFASSTNKMSSLANLKFLKLNRINPDGSYHDPVTHQYDYASSISGATTQEMPSILTVAWSWTTAASRGLAHTGRIYPPVGITASSTTQLTTGQQDAFVTAASNLLSALASTFKFAPRVVSSQNAIRPITGIRVGSLIDVQRRRKDALTETYRSADWPPGP